MIYPKFLKDEDVISLTAPSEGCSNEEIDLNAFENGINEFKKRGITIKETPDCKKNYLGRSDNAKVRAKEFEDCFKDEETNAVLCYAGGEFLIETLSHVNFDIIKENPKWFLGFSDPTSLLFYITTTLDIATLYGNNFRTFQMTPWHKSLENNVRILKGNIIEQRSFDKYENERKEHVTGTEPFNLDTKVKWKNKDVLVIRKDAPIINGSKEDRVLLNEEFDTEDEALAFVEKEFSNNYDFAFKLQKDGIEYGNGDVRLWRENVDNVGISIEVGSEDEEKIEEVLEDLDVRERLTQSLPEYMYERQKEDK